MKHTFKSLWKSLPQPGDPMWNNSSSREKRDALELLCGALWHLELASELGDIPEDWLGSLLQQKTSWEVWMQRRGDRLIKACVDHPPSDSVRIVLQNMCVANAALRIAGARDVLRRISDIPKDKTALWNSCALRKCVNPDNYDFKPHLRKLDTQVVLVVAFRDTYMHGEKPEKLDPPRTPKACHGGRKPPQKQELDRLRGFRETQLFGSPSRYSLRDIYQACLYVWQGLVNPLLASLGMPTIG